MLNVMPPGVTTTFCLDTKTPTTGLQSAFTAFRVSITLNKVVTLLEQGMKEPPSVFMKLEGRIN